MIKFNIVVALALSLAVTSTTAIQMKNKCVQEVQPEVQPEVTAENKVDMDKVLLNREVEVKEVDMTDA